jgi:hypothetical protein
MTPDHESTAERGRRLVRTELQERGVSATVSREGHLTLLVISSPVDGHRIRLRVKTRTSGTWQGSIRDADPDPTPSHPPTYWIFVELERGGRPGFFVVPDPWMRRDIFEAHQRYLRRHGGVRAVAADSTHHAIEPKRILQWRERWDLLDI